MAEEEGKALPWPKGAEKVQKISEFEFLMCGNDDKPILKIEKEKLNEFIVVNGEGVKAIAGGATSATPTILRPGPNGQNRKMEDVQGWFVNGTSAEPPVATGSAWEAPTGKKNTNWWDGTAKVWSLGSSVPLPKGANGKTIEKFSSTKTGGYSAGDQIFFTNDDIWQAASNTNEGESPATHPAKWGNNPVFKTTVKNAIQEGDLFAVNSKAVRDLFFGSTDNWSNKSVASSKPNEGYHAVNKVWYTASNSTFRFIRFDEDFYITCNQDGSAWKTNLIFFDEELNYANNYIADFLTLSGNTNRKLVSFAEHGSKGYYVGFNSLDTFITKIETKTTSPNARIKEDLLPVADNSGTQSQLLTKYDIVDSWSPNTDLTRYFNNAGGSTTFETVGGNLVMNANLPSGAVCRLGAAISAAYLGTDVRYVTIVLKGKITATNVSKFNLRNEAGNPFYTILDNLTDGVEASFNVIIKHFFDSRNSASTKNMFTEFVRRDASIAASATVTFELYKFLEFNDFAGDNDYRNKARIVNLTKFNRKYEGKKMVTLGHSIVYQNEWQKILASIIGANYNYLETSDRIKPLAIGGATIRAVHTNATVWDYSVDGVTANGKKHSTIWYRARYVKELNPDIIGIMSGTNDSSTPATVGTSSDAPYLDADEKLATDPTAPSFCASLNGIFQQLLTDNPKALIFYCSLARNWFYNPANGAGEITGNRYAQFLAEKACCERYGVVFVDLLNDSGISHFNAKSFYKADSDEAQWQAGTALRVHPNSAGGEMIARTIAKRV